MKITKANAKKFFESINNFIIELGARGGQTNFDHNCYEYVIDTIVGDLNITVYNNQQGSNCYMLFGRFADTNKAKVKIDCNPHSGKYNFASTNDNVNDAIEWAKHHLEVTQKVLVD